MGETIGNILILAFVVGLMIMVWRRSQSEVKAWEEFAADHGLQFESSLPRIRRFDQTPFVSIKGSYRGKAIKLEALEKGAFLSAILGGGRGRPFTRITREVQTTKPGLLTFELRQRGATTPPSQIGTGDEQLDRMFSINSTPPDLAETIFKPSAIRETVRGLKGILILDAQGLHYEEAGLEHNAERLKRLIDLLADLSSTIERVVERYLKPQQAYPLD